MENTQSTLRLYKLLNRDKNHYGFIYDSNGLNVDCVPFNPKGECSRGGLYFCNEIQLYNYASFGVDAYWICKVTIPEDAKVYHENGKSKADCLTLSDCEIFDEQHLEKYIDFTNTNILLGCIKTNSDAFQKVENPTLEFCLEAVKQNGFALQYVKDQTPEICLAAVKQNGFALQFLKEQTPEICLEAVKQDGRSLNSVKVQTSEICLAAVKENGRALKYVKNQTFEICLEAVKQNEDALEYVNKLFLNGIKIMHKNLQQ